MPSVRSQVIDAVQAALGSDVPVHRFLPTPLGEDETVAWNITWGAEEVTDEDEFSVVRRLPIELHYANRNSVENPDSMYDAAYLQAVAITNDEGVVALVREINETGTSPEVIEGDEGLIYAMTVSFEVVYSTQRGDPTTGA